MNIFIIAIIWILFGVSYINSDEVHNNVRSYIVWPIILTLVIIFIPWQAILGLLVALFVIFLIQQGYNSTNN